MTRAQTIIASAAQAVAGINDPRDRLARQVGILQGENRALNSADPVMAEQYERDMRACFQRAVDRGGCIAGYVRAAA